MLLQSTGHGTDYEYIRNWLCHLTSSSSPLTLVTNGTTSPGETFPCLLISLFSNLPQILSTSINSLSSCPKPVQATMSLY